MSWPRGSGPGSTARRDQRHRDEGESHHQCPLRPRADPPDSHWRVDHSRANGPALPGVTRAVAAAVGEAAITVRQESASLEGPVLGARAGASDGAGAGGVSTREGAMPFARASGR